MRLFTDGVCIKLLTLLKSRVLHAKSPSSPFGDDSVDRSQLVVSGADPWVRQ
jgi:hypothetical protein